MSEFDQFADTYEADLQKGLRLSGEDHSYFASGRMAAVRRFVASIGARPKSIVELGCGVGGNTPHVARAFPQSRLFGLDVSEDCLGIARRRHGGERRRFMTPEQFVEETSGTVDMVYCNGVFHHVPPDEWLSTFAFVRSILDAAGIAAIFDNNPFNPATRLVMSRIPFDRDAVLISPYGMRSMAMESGFDSAECRFFFLFPRMLRGLRRLEAYLERLPLGAQYGIFAVNSRSQPSAGEGAA